ncbi:unnamed protein product [Lactuca saligna]|uniref:Cytochrome P450 n=1 Tax=Lactuca saligna TaxID=75948 RepID=A0AA36E1U7_LACSI|nr:unnamed protein product [Lactuca saligna]
MKPVSLSLTVLSISLCCAYLIKFLYKVWWKPIWIQSKMRSHGINGPPYRFLHGNTKEIMNIKKSTDRKPMEGLGLHIGPKVQPHIFSWINTYGNTFVCWNGPKPELVITDLDIMKEVMNDKSGAFPKDDVEGYFKILLGDGLVVSSGEKWIKMRKLANHVFHANSLRDMTPAMVASVDVMLEKWKQYEGKEIEVYEEFKLLTSDIISRTAFGSSYVEGKEIFQMLRKLTAIIARNAYKTRLPFKTKDDAESKMIDQMMRESIMDIVKRREKEVRGEINNFGNDFLGSLMKANQSFDHGYKVTIQDIIDEFKTFYIAGHETTTGLLAWSIFLLAVHKDYQEKAREESFKLFNKTNPNSDDLSRMKMITMIINETLRLFPPVVSLIRKSKHDVSLGALKIPGNRRLNFPILFVHHDTRIWGEDAHLFKPERFSQGVAKATNNNPAMFIPFGLGPRSCVGSNFATNQAKIALSMILQTYSFTLSPTYIHSPCELLTICPKFGVPVLFCHL